MTSATQSNSGASAYIGFLYALLGNPDVITEEDLQSETLKTQVRELFSGVDRSSGSSDWLKDMFLAGDYDAMVNYECLIIQANEELTARGEEPLYVVYPYDGLSIADSPLGYVDAGDEAKEELFLDLQAYLLSEETQSAIQRTGRRSSYTGVSEENRDVFPEAWGLQPDRVLSPIRMPAADVLFACLNLYQTGAAQALVERLLPGLLRQHERGGERTARLRHGADPRAGECRRELPAGLPGRGQYPHPL